jgi:NAD(P)-dependent dehydrogenase (short-subunit alcohol dehydrogenase family)
MGVLDLFNLEGKKALVTGGGQGIGRGFCLTLAEAGADVAVVDVNEVTAAAVAEEVQALGRNAVAIKTDVTVPDDVEEMALIVEEELGGLDIAVNNAGIGRPGTAEGMTKANWDLTIAINLTGVFLCCQAEAQIMIPQRRGKIVNTASISGTMANAVVAYGASKAGVIMLTKRMAAEWGKYNINVNCLSPSWTVTPMTDRVPDETKKRWKDLTPLGRVEVPEDMCGALVFLASDASNYVTGQNLIVDGGHILSVWIDGTP